ncbi:MAG TPA: diguanylate cyclase [Gaiellaceae bacterium]|nr:diguanylate cyclase [Gaiellaceae bacterium]
MPTWEFTTWIVVGVSALAALLLGVTVILAVRLLRGGDAAARSAREREQAWEEVRRERTASARARSELRWLRHLADAAPAGSLEGSLRRVLESAAGLGECAAAMLVLSQGDGEPLVAAYGLSDDESTRELLGLPPGGGEARAVSLAYRYTPEEEARDEFRLRGGLALPVGGANGGRLGTLGVFWRREREVTEDELERLEGLAAALGPSLRNAFRFEELRRTADCDSTGLPGRRRLQEAIAVECARARRYTHPLGLVLLRAAGGSESVERAASRLPADVRAPDLVHHLGGGRFAVVLPESSLVDAERLARRLRLALGEGRMPVALAELRFEDDAVSLLERAEAALAGAEQAAAAGRDWSTAVEPGG